MLLCSNFILNGVQDGQCFEIAPWLDKVNNVVDVADIVASVRVPDIPAVEIINSCPIKSEDFFEYSDYSGDEEDESSVCYEVGDSKVEKKTIVSNANVDDYPCVVIKCDSSRSIAEGASNHVQKLKVDQKVDAETVRENRHHPPPRFSMAAGTVSKSVG